MAARGMILIVVAALAAGAGCARHIDCLPFMDYFPYHEPAGFSSTYHRSLYGPLPPGLINGTTQPTAIGSSPRPPRPSAAAPRIDDERDAARDSLPGAHFARHPVRSDLATPRPSAATASPLPTALFPMDRVPR